LYSAEHASEPKAEEDGGAEDVGKEPTPPKRMKVEAFTEDSQVEVIAVVATEGGLLADEEGNGEEDMILGKDEEDEDPIKGEGGL
jgi:hypothetical protein